MEVAPRYDADPWITIDGPIDDQREPMVRQRRRLQTALRALTDEQWRTPSRCEGWTVQDVVAHLIGTNAFWQVSIASGVAGSPTKYLVGFDPVATPAQMVEPMRAMTPAQTLDELAKSTDGLLGTVEALDERGWSAIGESPVGHVRMRELAHHALWDSWIHERDVLLPLGISPVEEADEVLSSLCYVAALTAALSIPGADGRTGSMVLEVTDPDARYVLDLDDSVRLHEGSAPDDALVLRGRAVDVVEILSLRAPFTLPVPEDKRWMLGGLAQLFDVARR
jgi:uncharacterized protein (TIGR03083 family)